MKSSSLYHTTMLLAAPALLGLGTVAQAQLFSDDVGTAALWTEEGDFDINGNPETGTVEDIRYGFDYGSFDIFSDGFITGSIAEAPNSSGGASTTGLFVSANNNSLVSTSLFAGVRANGVDVGAGTATPDYVLKFDAFQSVTTGIDGDGPPRATNYQFASINYAADGYRGPFATGSSGQTLAFTGEQGSGDDWEVTIGDKSIESDAEGFNGLATTYINDAFIASGFDPVADADPLVVPDPLVYGTENASHFSPIPGQEQNFNYDDPATQQQYWVDQFGPNTDPLHFDTPENENANDFLAGGTPYNRWVEHEIYYVDGVWTYVIDGSMILQVDPETAGDATQIASDSGTFALGFLDGFSSFNDTPEGSNFVIYDNISLDAATSLDVPDMTQFLIDNGYIPDTVVALAGDYNGNGTVDAADYTIWADNFNSTTELAADGNGDGTINAADYTVWADNFGNMAALSSGAFPIPEPSAGLILAGLGLIAARRRRQA